MILSGSEFLLEVKVGAEFVAVEEMHTYSDDKRRNIARYPVFNRTTPHKKVGKPDSTYSVEGYLDPSDPGQAELFAAEAEAREAELRITFSEDGSGFTQKVLVTSRRRDANADDETLQGIAFDFEGTEAEEDLPAS